MDMVNDGSPTEHFRSAGKLAIAVLAAWAVFAGTHLLVHRPRAIRDSGGIHGGESCRLAPVVPEPGYPPGR